VFFCRSFGEDWEMWTRIASKFSIAYSPKYLAFIEYVINKPQFYYWQNVDIKKVISIIQNYIPVNKQSK
jgi:hypothetical protein